LSRAKNSVDEKLFVSTTTSLLEINSALTWFPNFRYWAKGPAPNTYRGSIAIGHPSASLDDDSGANQSCYEGED
jgi:hypothetical protein